jgi:hypothetical protein
VVSEIIRQSRSSAVVAIVDTIDPPAMVLCRNSRRGAKPSIPAARYGGASSPDFAKTVL